MKQEHLSGFCLCFESFRTAFKIPELINNQHNTPWQDFDNTELCFSGSGGKLPYTDNSILEVSPRE